MSWRWVKRRRLTIGIVLFFAVWYLAQLYVLSAFGLKTAIWWFYFSGGLSPGHLLAPISHNMADLGHLRRNAVVLLIAGGLVEPYLERRKYAALLLTISFVSILFANLLSLALGTQWTLAGPSGGIYGLWAYIAVRNRFMILDTSVLRGSVEAALVLGGLLTLIFVPIFDVYTTSVVNVSHAAGVLLGYAIALVEVPPQVGSLTGG